MKRLALVTALVTVFAVPAYAHTHLEKSVPANGSTVATAPASVDLEFAHPVRVTALTIQKGEAKGEPLGPLPQDAATKISVPAPKLAPGAYVVNWRAVSSDNHVMSGKIQFTIAPAK